jgi:hypothetical protein
MSIDERTADHELLMASGQVSEEDIKTINMSLKGMGLCLDDPSMWIGDTGATAHTTAYIENTKSSGCHCSR